jgi:hypothetical protein
MGSPAGVEDPQLTYEENNMTTEPQWPEGWTEVERPPSLYRRFEFDGEARR